MIGGRRSIGAGRTILVSAVSFRALQHKQLPSTLALLSLHNDITGTKLSTQPSLKLNSGHLTVFMKY